MNALMTRSCTLLDTYGAYAAHSFETCSNAITVDWDPNAVARRIEEAARDFAHAHPEQDGQDWDTACAPQQPGPATAQHATPMMRHLTQPMGLALADITAAVARTFAGVTQPA